MISRLPGAADEQELRARLALRLRAKRDEIENAVFTRISAAVPIPNGSGLSPEYAAGVAEAVRDVVGFGLSGIEHGAELETPVPGAALEQARRAAREGVGLDTVLRRYAVGHSVLDDYVMSEAEVVPRGFLRDVMTQQHNLLDRLIEAISGEHTRESERLRLSYREHRAHQVESLLAGERVHEDVPGYKLEAWHIAAIVGGERTRDVAAALETWFRGDALVIHRSDDLAWVWLGAPEYVSARSIADRVGPKLSACSITISEPSPGPSGFRRSHEQARAARRVAVRLRKPVTLYADVVLLSAAMENQGLADALDQIYLAPFRENGDAELLQTLRAYVASQRNVSSAASLLGVHRHTVARHLDAIANRLGRPVHDCLADLEVALRLDQVIGTSRNL